ncbi:DUF2059 domain-containing protein [Desulfoferula mesophila]|uniref:DUF2059 domain-containing protein n=1 Tax=Desulfoferula mesophila TaxID=3058419 RepID=A0AAU9EQX7_9BACT|nr:hypothetical protein FAK_25850 [Desulfoferula mesophilus]
MRKLVLLLGLCLCLLLPSVAMSADQPSAKDTAQRLQSAQEYWKLSEVQKQIMDTIQRISGQLPPDQRQKFIDQGKAYFDEKRIAGIKKQWVAMCAEVFTAKELKAMVKFYGSPEGMAIRDKMPKLMDGNTKVIGGELSGFIKQEQTRLAKEAQEKAKKEAAAKPAKTPPAKDAKPADAKK